MKKSPLALVFLASSALYVLAQVDSASMFGKAASNGVFGSAKETEAALRTIDEHLDFLRYPSTSASELYIKWKKNGAEEMRDGLRQAQSLYNSLSKFISAQECPCGIKDYNDLRDKLGTDMFRWQKAYGAVNGYAALAYASRAVGEAAQAAFKVMEQYYVKAGVLAPYFANFANGELSLGRGLEEANNLIKGEIPFVGKTLDLPESMSKLLSLSLIENKTVNEKIDYLQTFLDIHDGIKQAGSINSFLGPRIGDEKLYYVNEMLKCLHSDIIADGIRAELSAIKAYVESGRYIDNVSEALAVLGEMKVKILVYENAITPLGNKTMSCSCGTGCQCSHCFVDEEEPDEPQPLPAPQDVAEAADQKPEQPQPAPILAAKTDKDADGRTAEEVAVEYFKAQGRRDFGKIKALSADEWAPILDELIALERDRERDEFYSQVVRNRIAKYSRIDCTVEKTVAANDGGDEEFAEGLQILELANELLKGEGRSILPATASKPEGLIMVRVSCLQHGSIYTNSANIFLKRLNGRWRVLSTFFQGEPNFSWIN